MGEGGRDYRKGVDKLTVKRILRKERTAYGKSLRKSYESGEVWESRHRMTRHAIRPDELSNTLSTVLKDNLLIEIYGITEEYSKGSDTLTKVNEELFEGKPFNYVSLFSGIGGFEQALNKLGGTCVLASEIDKFANKAYEILYGQPTAGDITQIDAKDVPDHDVLVGGFPCQAFSVAGKRLGFEDTRGTLFFEVARIAREKQPKVVLLENVKGLVGHDKGRTLDTIVKTLNDIGYTVDFEVLNSKYFGVPQNRERIFIVAVRDDLIEAEPWIIEGNTIVPKGKRRISEYEGVKTFNFDWPEQGEVTTRLRDILETEVDEKYYLDDEKTAKLVAQLEARPNDENIPLEGFGRLAGLRNRDDRVFAYQGDKKRSTAQENIYLRDKAIADSVTVGHMPKYIEGLPIREATKQGYSVACEGDAVNFQFPDSKTRRGRVGKQIANTLEASNINQGVVERSEPCMLGHIDLKGHDAIKRVYSAEHIGPTLTTMGGGHREPKTAVSEGTRYRIRKLTPKECLRLQSFPDEVHSKLVEAGISDTQLYKMSGNAVTVSVIEAIGVNLLPYLKESDIV